MLKEREETLRDEYDKILSAKLLGKMWMCVYLCSQIHTCVCVLVVLCSFIKELHVICAVAVRDEFHFTLMTSSLSVCLSLSWPACLSLCPPLPLPLLSLSLSRAI